jgi:hypothetical protein
MQLSTRNCIAASLVAAGVLGTRVAHADGSLEVRTVYYKERATRVIQPMLDGIFEIGEKGVLAVHLLVDAITSASSGSGAVNATPFSKTREEAGASYTHRLGQLQIGADTKYSTEDDYVSYFIGAHGLVDLAQKNTTIGFGGGISLDTLTAAGSQGPSQITLACNPGNLANQQTSCPLDIYSGYGSVAQILSRDLLGGLTYDISDLRGFQSNPYRLVVTDDGLVPERHPDRRFRQAFGASLRYYIEQTETTLIGAYRYYIDDWHIHAQTPELRVVQQIGANADAGIRFRFYTQTAAFFYEDRYATSNVAVQPFLSDDPKMSAFSSETMEAKLGVFGREFELKGIWADARFEGILAYIVQHNAFGNAVEAQAALILPFSY